MKFYDCWPDSNYWFPVDFFVVLWSIYFAFLIIFQLSIDYDFSANTFKVDDTNYLTF